MADAVITGGLRGGTAPRGRRSTGLRREIGFIGLLWASRGSIIGSGWLFGAQGALATAGPAAIISWVIGASRSCCSRSPTPRSAVWLPVYLVGMGLIVYLSDFGPTARPRLPLWWDMLAVAVFSLGIFYWALRVALPTERIQQLVDRGAAVSGERRVC